MAHYTNVNEKVIMVGIHWAPPNLVWSLRVELILVNLGGAADAVNQAQIYGVAHGIFDAV